MKLVTMMAKACHYAQEHVDDSDAWHKDERSREGYFTCVSFQMACFLAQNTGNGLGGVECDVVLEDLVGKMKSEQAWEKLLNKIAKELGGWKKE